MNGSDWAHYREVRSTGDQSYMIADGNLDPNITYKFRVIAIREDNNKQQIGLPSPASSDVRPHCIG